MAQGSLHKNATLHEVSIHWIRTPVWWGSIILLCASALIAFTEREFPILLGILVWVLSLLTVRQALAARYFYWVSLFLPLFVVAGFPVGLAFMIIKKDKLTSMSFVGSSLDSFNFSEMHYSTLLLVSAAGIFGFYLAQIILSAIAVPRKARSADTIGNSKEGLAKLIVVTALLGLVGGFVSLYATAVEQVGIPGIISQTTVPYLYGFLFRLGITFVPTVILLLLHLIGVGGRRMQLYACLGISFLLGMGFLVLTSSRMVLLYYFLLPLIYISVSHPIRLRRLIPYKTFAIMVAFLLVFGIVFSIILRGAFYESVSGGGDQLSSVESLSWEDLGNKLENGFSFFTRLLGAREVGYITSADGLSGDGWRDIEESFFAAREESDTLHRRHSDYTDLHSDDFAFETGYMLFGVLFVPYAPDVFLGMLTVFTGSFLVFVIVWLAERTILSLFGSYAVSSVFTWSFFMHLWQAGTFPSFMVRSLVMYVLSFFLLYLVLRIAQRTGSSVAKLSNLRPSWEGERGRVGNVGDATSFMKR